MVSFLSCRRLLVRATIAAPMLAWWSGTAAARPVHATQSSPAAETILHGNRAQYVVRFDGPINHLASRLEITQNGKVVQVLHPLGDSAVDVLFANDTVPAAGRYMLHWEAVSATGDRTVGDIPFSVQ